MLAVWTVEFEDGQQVTDSGSHDSHHARRCLHWLTNTGFKLQGSGLESCAAREFYRQVAESTNQEAARGGKKNGDLMSASVWALGSRIQHGSNFLPHKLRRLHPVARSVVGRQAGVCTPADTNHTNPGSRSSKLDHVMSAAGAFVRVVLALALIGSARGTLSRAQSHFNRTRSLSGQPRWKSLLARTAQSGTSHPSLSRFRLSRVGR